MDKRVISLTGLNLLVIATRSILGVTLGYIFFFGVSTVSHAQPQPDQLNQLVEKLKAQSNDAALREEIIKLALESKPAQTISEAARRAFVQGNTIAKDAKDVEGQKLAVQKFKEATDLAPWWADAYYNLAIAQELTGSLAEARASWEWYIKTNPGENERRTARDRIYSLEASEQLNKTNAENQAAKAEAQRRAAADQRRREEDAVLSGPWNGVGSDGGIFTDVFLRRNTNGSISIVAPGYPNANPPTWTISGHLSENQTQADWTFETKFCGLYWNLVPVRLSSDRRRFEVTVPECYWNHKEKRAYFSVQKLTWTFTAR